MASPEDRIARAFESAIYHFKTSVKDKKILEELSKTTTIEEVYDATDAIQEEQRKKGHLRNLARIQPFLEGLRSYAKVIEVFVGAKQNILSLVWGPIKLLLHWTHNMKLSFDAILEVFVEIGLLLPEFQKISELFQSNECIKDVLVLFFRDIIDFYIIALVFFRKPYWKSIFESMWPKQLARIKIVRDSLERHTALLRREVRLETILEASAHQKQALEYFERTERSLRQQEYLVLRNDIDPVSYEDTFHQLRLRHCQGTGKWLFNNPSISKWLKTADTSLKTIWLQGIPGSGKTFLSYSLIDRISKENCVQTIFAFLSHEYSENFSELSFIHSLIFQLASGNEHLQDILCAPGNLRLKTSFDKSVDLLKTLLHSTLPTYVIIDGLDEINEIRRRHLLKTLLQISADCQSIKLLISSRGEADIRDLMKDQVSICANHHNAESIHTFVNQRTAEWFLKCDFIQEAQDEIRSLLTPLAPRSKGMFLYVEIILNSMEFLDSIDQIRSELTVLPENLDAAYLRILRRINSFNKPLKQKVRKILGWIGCSSTPLTVREIEQALVVSRQDSDGDGKVITSVDLRRICGPIVEVVDNYAHFVHFTVKEYLFSPNVNESLNMKDATLSLAVCCVTFLTQRHHDSTMEAERLTENVLSGSYILHDYAIASWIPLVERYCQLLSGNVTSAALIQALKSLANRMSNLSYSGKVEGFPEVSFQCLRRNTSIYELLLQSSQFQRTSEQENFDKIKDISWTELDPLTTSTTSVRIHLELKNLISQSDGYTEHIKILQRHYGKLLFKCSLLHCPYGRYGFGSKKDLASHLKHHDRPWKCTHEDCVYAEGGFLSRKMRDDHDRDHHHGANHKKQLEGEELESEELQSLLFDLVKADQVEIVRSLREKIKKLPVKFMDSLAALICSAGSVEMFDEMRLGVLNDWRGDLNFDWTSGPAHSIRAENRDVFFHLLPIFRSKVYDPRKQHDTGKSLKVCVAELIRSGSNEFLEEWEKQMMFDLSDHLFVKDKRAITKDSRRMVQSAYIHPSVISASDMNAGREMTLIRLWNWQGVFNKSVCEDADYNVHLALRNVAATTCSLKLAEYLVSKGANPRLRQRGYHRLPLHCAARKTSSQAAEMMKFLLLHRADPEVPYKNGGRICDEVGPKGIARHLGMSWDELVNVTKKGKIHDIIFLDRDSSDTSAEADDDLYV